MIFIVLFSLPGGLELFADLLQRFPNNIHLLLEIAKVGLIVFQKFKSLFNMPKFSHLVLLNVTFSRLVLARRQHFD